MEAEIISTLLLHVDPVSTRITALQKCVKSLGEVSEALPSAHKQLMDVQSQLTKIHFLLTRPDHPLSPPLRDAVCLNAVHIDAHLRRTLAVLSHIETYIRKNQTSVLRFLRTDAVCKQLNQVLRATASMRASCQELITEILLGKLREQHTAADERTQTVPAEQAGPNQSYENGEHQLQVGATDQRGYVSDDDTAAFGAEPRAMRLSEVPPSDLPNALRAVLLGTHTPAQCLPLLEQRATTHSLASWYAAHELLMLAVADNAELCSPHYRGADSHWLQQVYQCATLLILPDEAERRRVVRCLREAEAVGLVEVAAAVIGDIFVTQSLRSRVELGERADEELWTRLLLTERGLADLTEALNAYRRAQRFSQLVGIALQIIPLAGGPLSGLLSAGAEVAAGVDVSDVVETVLGYAVEVGVEVVQSVRDRVLSRARVVVSDGSLDAMDDSKREVVVTAIEESGMSLAVLRDLLDSRSGGSVIMHDEATGVEDADGAEELRMERKGRCTMYPEGRDNASSQSIGPADEDDFCVDVDEGESLNVVGLIIDEPAGKCGSWWQASGLEGRKNGDVDEGVDRILHSPSEFRDVFVTRTTVAGIGQKELAMWWAAYSLGFEDAKIDEFYELWPALLEFLESEELSGNDLSICDEDAEAVSIEAVRAAKGAAKRLPFGRKRKLVRFLAELRSL